MTGKPKKKEYPAIRGLSWKRTEYYSFFVSIDWHRFIWPDGQQGELHGPDPDDPSTVFAVSVQDLGTTVTADDLDVLAEGFFETVDQLPEAQVEVRNQKDLGNVLELEAKYTFCEDGNTRKRWVRVYYHETRQIVLTAQGATPEKYDYWLPLFFQAMMSIGIHSTKPDFPAPLHNY